MWKAMFRGFLAHKFRLALTTLSVVLGVGFVSGTYVLTDTMNAAFDELFAEITSRTDVVVRAKADFVSRSDDRRLIPERVLGRVRAIEGVAAAEGGVDGFAQIVGPDGEPIGRTGPPTLGVSISRSEDFQVLSLRDGRRPARAGEMAVDARTAADNGIEVGDVLTVLFEGPPERFKVVGIVGFGSADNLGGATLAAFDLRTAQRVLGSEGGFDGISVRAAQGQSTTELRARIEDELPPRLEALTASEVGQEQADAIQEGLGFFRTALLIFAGVALFVGAFIIFNTFNILISQRTKELALLRALGAQQGQVMRSVLAESSVTGLVAAGLGLLFGLLMASGLRALLEGFGISLPTTSLRVLPRTIIAAVALGLLVTVVASLMPARRAARIAPMAALREGEGIRPMRTGLRALGGSALAALGIAFVGIALLGDAGGLRLVGLGVLITFLGLSVLSPVLARPLTRVLGAPLPRIAGVAGKLGRNNAARNPRRTASTAAALMIGLALVGTFSIMGSSVKASVGQVIEETLRADFTLQASTQFSGFSNAVARRLARDERLASVVPFIFAEWREPGSDTTRFLSAVDPRHVEEAIGLDIRSGSLEEFREDAVMVHTSIADAKDLRAGEKLRMRFPTGARTMAIAGTYEQNGLVGDYMIAMSTYRSIYPTRLHTIVAVKAASGVTPATARTAIERVTDDFANVKVQDQAELRAEQEDQVDQLLGLINALLGLAILIALLGIVNTLALSVFERTRELGLLRAVGLSRRQTRRMIRWEAIVIGLLGGVLGLATGLVFGTILVRALSDEGIDRLAIPGMQLIIFLIAAGLAGVLAAIGPARRASRMDVLKAIAYE